uniref:Probable protein-export membrane protein SecG n=1 Tax=Porphyridium purpureum TaxID=35688 RepID=W0RZ21_PORPP|nr:preprotein translocase SecG subunit [Porphyridium purpureum]ATJ02852.1 preprotein translocase SecG subunit [Porphyridium purpureum]BAO23625.1 preprotein translocase SecG subunit [Porphyridium purpureum]
MNLLKFIWYCSAILSIVLILLSNPKSNSLGFNTNVSASSSKPKNRINLFTIISTTSFIVSTILLSYLGNK